MRSRYLHRHPPPTRSAAPHHSPPHAASNSPNRVVLHDSTLICSITRRRTIPIDSSCAPAGTIPLTSFTSAPLLSGLFAGTRSQTAYSPPGAPVSPCPLHTPGDPHLTTLVRPHTGCGAAPSEFPPQSKVGVRPASGSPPTAADQGGCREEGGDRGETGGDVTERGAVTLLAAGVLVVAGVAPVC